MEKSYKRMSFDLELAKKIQSGKIKGNIACDLGTIRLIEFDLSPIHNTIEGTIVGTFMYGEKELLMFDNNGICTNRSAKYNLFIELPEETPKHEFMPFDKVLVRNCEYAVWDITFFSHYDYEHNRYITMGRRITEFCIPYAGHENLVGTTKNPE